MIKKSEQDEQENPSTAQYDVEQPAAVADETVPAGSNTPGALPPSVVGTSQDPNRPVPAAPASKDQFGNIKE